jgi:hypothetical protein
VSNWCSYYLWCNLVTEPGLNGLSNRLGYTMNETEAYTKDARPENTNGVFVGWETLTHAENGA